ncbi:ArsR/SmtB family transcription factor [Vallitalea okinawensis]|uniref:ArsR/SmtB family transcription factor n=1 Tax=Vallitalea okinawensis TaxID=2078660 RepID=UPI000CFDA60F|nr:metalloregulator ArsR/SmtB family transcription factor [Vallitalea okinawensis]
MNNEYELKVIHKPSYYIEMVALLHSIITKQKEPFTLDKDYTELINIFHGLNLKGCELFEFFLHNPIENYNELKTYFENLDELEFLTILFDNTFSAEEVKQLYKDFDSIKMLAKVNVNAMDNDTKSMKYIFQETESFAKKLLVLFQDLDHIVTAQMKHTDMYQEKMKIINSMLQKMMPINVSQEIMGKKFRKQYAYTSFYFVPSYFFKRFPMRTYNDHTQILAYPILDYDYYDEKYLVKAMKILGDRIRLQMVKKLSQRPMFGKELAQELGIGPSTVSHHLDQLNSVKLLHIERDKNTKYFSLNHNEYHQLLDGMKKYISKIDH